MTFGFNIPPLERLKEVASVAGGLDSIAINDLQTVEAQRYTPRWTASGSGPAIGNGTLVGRYGRIGNVVTVAIYVLMGSTTTFGAGTWQFTIPIPSYLPTATAPLLNGLALAYGRDNSASLRTYTGIGLVQPTSIDLVQFGNSSANLLQSTAPFTWAVNDELWLNATYLLAF